MKRLHLMMFCCSLLALGPVAVKAQFISVPLYFGVTNSVKNEIGIMLKGTALVPGDYVQLLRADQGIFPPSTNGNPHLFNPILAETRIGMGTDPGAGAIGKFSSSVSINRYVVTPMFVRVFNRHTAGEASFYCDSQIYSNSVTTYGIFIANASATSMQLDPGDDDNDYVSNSWEETMGTDHLNPDTDGDGMLDGEEFAAGTQPLDATDFLQMAHVDFLPGGNLNIHWHSVTGKWYQVEYSTNITAGNSAYVPYGEIIEGNGSTSWSTITNGANLPNATFRVRLK